MPFVKLSCPKCQIRFRKKITALQQGNQFIRNMSEIQPFCKTAMMKKTAVLTMSPLIRNNDL